MSEKEERLLTLEVIIDALITVLVQKKLLTRKDVQNEILRVTENRNSLVASYAMTMATTR